MGRKLYEVIKGDMIKDIPEDVRVPLIEGIISKNDYIAIIAPEKMGKTLFAQQMTCSLSSGSPFLDTFNVPNKCMVWYFATEVNKFELQDRFVRLSNTVPTDFNNIVLIPTRFRFNTPEGVECMNDIIKECYPKPDVIIVDVLGKAVKGSTKSDDIINEFNNQIDIWMAELDCATIITHHMKKQGRNKDGQLIARSDQDTHGSVYILGGVDHAFWIEKWHGNDGTNDRFVRCDTQRSGSVATDIRIRMKQPNPLCWELISKHYQERLLVADIIRKVGKEGVCMDDLISKTNIGRTTLYKVTNELFNEHIITKSGKRPVRFSLIN